MGYSEAAEWMGAMTSSVNSIINMVESAWDDDIGRSLLSYFFDLSEQTSKYRSSLEIADDELNDISILCDEILSSDDQERPKILVKRR